MRKLFVLTLFTCISFAIFSCTSTDAQEADNQPRKIEILFLGHDSEHHNSAAYEPILASALADDGINFTYSEEPGDLNEENLSKYDALLLYANHDSISTSQEEALLNFVDSGNGFIPLHSASYCFRNSEEIVDLVGAQFEKHGTGTFQADILNTDHPVMEGIEEFETWDETYVHNKHNEENRTVLMERDGEAWTWVRTYGEGRVFYTAYGHDERTWGKKEFQELLKNGIVWSVSEQARSNWEQYAADMPDLEYEDRSNIPNYEERDPAPKYQLPLPPEESMKFAQVPPGFKLELFSSEPDIINPIEIDWDAQGRLWAIETVDYPNEVRQENETGDDKIKILEDTDDDGKADKVTVFADSLNIPTSFVFANGGIIVSQAPHFLFLKDTDGDDKADVRRKIITGWGTFDTHAGPSQLQYGFDNQIWGSVGYSGFDGVVNGESFKFGQGFFRFTPDFDDINFEYLTATTNNTWGLGFNETFDVFGSTANNEHAVYMGIPLRYYKDYQWPEGVEKKSLSSEKIDGHYAMHPITRNYRQVDVFGGFTAAAGLEFYTARAFPEKYWNRIAFVNEPTGGLVHRAIIEEDTAGYAESDGWNIFASHDEWASPTQAKVGPDGALWLTDWYNFIVQHNPTPSEERGGYKAETGEGNAYRNSLRDRSRGRIYRISYDDNDGVDGDRSSGGSTNQMSLSIDDPGALTDALSNDNMFWRLTAQRLLVQRGKTDVLNELYPLVEDTDTSSTGLKSGAIHALWTIHGLGALDGENGEALDVAMEALNHPAAGVRKAAIQALPRNSEANQAIINSGVLQDPDEHTRLQAILATVEMEPSEQTGRILYAIESDTGLEKDMWLSQALKLAANKHEIGYLAAGGSQNIESGDAGGSNSATEVSVARGKMLSQKNACQTCHSADGTERTGPTWQNLFGHEVNLADGRTVTADEDYIRESITDSRAALVEGYQGGMPSYTYLSESEVLSLVEYIKSLSDN
jgi:putative membrane-bound dehydrogenase-like protein